MVWGQSRDTVYEADEECYLKSFGRGNTQFSEYGNGGNRIRKTEMYAKGPSEHVSEDIKLTRIKRDEFKAINDLRDRDLYNEGSKYREGRRRGE